MDSFVCFILLYHFFKILVCMVEEPLRGSYAMHKVNVCLAEFLKTYLKLGQNIRTESWR